MSDNREATRGGERENITNSSATWEPTNTSDAAVTGINGPAGSNKHPILVCLTTVAIACQFQQNHVRSADDDGVAMTAQETYRGHIRRT